MATRDEKDILLYIGTYTRKVPHAQTVSDGIYVYHFNPSSGALTFASKFADIENPSYLAPDAERGLLYSVNEVMERDGQPSGAVTAFSVDAQSGRLTALNWQLSKGRGPCHVWVDQTHRYLLVANYGSGSVAALPIRADGGLGEATGFVQHEGSSVNPDRQEGPHAHCVITDPDDQHIFVADLGLDKILIYRLNTENGALEAHGHTDVAAGEGPRHMAFHPSGRYMFLVTELGSSVMALAYDREAGTLKATDQISTLPDNFTGVNYCAAIHVHPSGRFVYASNRGHDSIAILGFDTDTGKLTIIGQQSTQGRFPRDFTIALDGNFLLAANQDTDNIITYRIDAETGKLEPVGQMTEVPTPVCLKWYQA